MSIETHKMLFILIVLTVVISSCSRPGTSLKDRPSVAAALTSVSDVESSVTTNVSNPLARNFVLCELRSAIWGSYDGTVEVGAAHTPDKKARRFEVRAGHLSVTTSETDLDVRAFRSGLVMISSKEDAFSRGVPFFIDEVRFAPPDSLSFRVWSNPAVTLNTAQRIQKVDQSESGYTTNIEIVDTHHPIASKPEPQTINIKENRIAGWVLSLVTSSDQNRCVASNEIDLTSLEKK